MPVAVSISVVVAKKVELLRLGVLSDLKRLVNPLVEILSKFWNKVDDALKSVFDLGRRKSAEDIQSCFQRIIHGALWGGFLQLIQFPEFFKGKKLPSSCMLFHGNGRSKETCYWMRVVNLQNHWKRIIVSQEDQWNEERQVGGEDEESGFYFRIGGNTWMNRGTKKAWIFTIIL